jgi:hypothetical protein
VFGVHGVGGILGALLTGVFAAPELGGTGVWDYVANGPGTFDGLFDCGQVWIQARAWDDGGVVRVVSFIAFKIVDITIGLRVTEEEEREGLDLSATAKRPTTAEPRTLIFSVASLLWMLGPQFTVAGPFFWGRRMHNGCMTRTIELASGGLRATIVPDLGGCVAGLWLEDLPVLRSVRLEGLTSVRQAGSYPLVPYSNRVGHARLQWNGTSHPLVTHQGPSPMPSTAWAGSGPGRCWRHDRYVALLSLEHRPDAAWPFAFDASQGIPPEWPMHWK